MSVGQMGIRDYLKQKYGASDSDITYNNGTVLLKNNPYMTVNPGADGVTRADMNQLRSADNSYAMGQNNAAMQGALQQYKDNISKPVQQFSYDANSDPAYQSALTQAKQNAQTAGNNAMVALGSRGIGNSSITGDRVAQIQQREYGNVVNNVLPGLIEQAYNRYQGQQQLQNQQNQNLLGLANSYNQQNQQLFNNNMAQNQFDLSRQNANLNAANQAAQLTGYYTGPKDDWSLLYNTQGAPMTAQNAYQQGQLGIQQQNANSMEQERQAMAKYREAESARQYALASGQIGAANKGNNLAQQRYNDEQNQRNIESQVMDHAQEFQSPQDVEDYFRANGAYLSQTLGAAGMNQLKNSLLSSYTADNKASNSLYSKAVAAAQKDPAWLMDGTDKKALIKQYQDILAQE